MALSFSACGNESAGQSVSASDQVESSTEESSSEEPSSEEPSSEEPSSEEPSSEESTTLTDWYNSADRTSLEDTINGIFESSGMTFFVTVEEPDTIIYNYQYTEQLDFSGASQEEIDASFAESLDAGAATIVSDISTYRTTYDIPLTTIRMTYLNADGSLIYSQDITEDYESPAASGDNVSGTSDAAYDSLQAWMESDEAALTIETTNKVLSSSGMTIDLSADGNVFVYEYYVSDELGMGDLTQEQLAASFDPVVESQRSSIETMFSTFETAYGLVLDGVRFTFFTEDGTELYSAEVANE